MVCPHCLGAETVFDDGEARKDLKHYLKRGPHKPTQLLLDLLRQVGVNGMSLLDIGGGVGAIQHELVEAGVMHTVDVDGSSAYLQAARSEADRRGYLDRAEFVHGDFVQVAADIKAADIVTLDKVICCYPDAQALVSLSVERAKRYYALVYPRDAKIIKWLLPIFNFVFFQLRGNPFRSYIHSTQMIDTLVQASGLTPIYHQHAGLMQVFVYERLQTLPFQARQS